MDTAENAPDDGFVFTLGAPGGQADALRAHSSHILLGVFRIISERATRRATTSASRRQR